MLLTKRNVVIGAVAIAVLGAGAVVFSMMNGGGHDTAMASGGPGGGPGGPGGPGGGPPGGPGGGRGGPPTQVGAFEVAPRVFSSRIEALGTLAPREQVTLTANAADRVTAVYFEDGQRVQRGKVLMTLVNEEENSQLEAARASEANTKLVYERNQRLAANDAIAVLELERSKSAYDAAVANVGAIEARLRDSEAYLMEQEKIEGEVHAIERHLVTATAHEVARRLPIETRRPHYPLAAAAEARERREAERLEAVWLGGRAQVEAEMWKLEKALHQMPESPA